MAGEEGTDPTKPVILLFRRDLRIADNRALRAAADTGKPVLPLFLRDDGRGGIRPLGSASRWWLHHSLSALAADLDALGLRLVFRAGAAEKVVRDLVRRTGADMVLWNRRYDPPSVEADRAMKGALRGAGIAAESFDGHLLHEPSRVKTGSGGPYKVYSPFRRALRAGAEPRDPLARPRRIQGFEDGIEEESLSDWKLLPEKPDWAGGIAGTWTPGEAGARKRLDRFLKGAIEGYAEGRDLPGVEATSRLSPHLAFGEITPFQIRHALGERRSDASARDRDVFAGEIAWREFSYHLLFHNPELAEQNFNRTFDAFAWSGGKKALRRWQQGRTGYPIVDAGMRQLWQTGWMHNRVRMVCASFLIKHLLVDWREGEKWFWDTLVDADPASNASNWQWVAGSGADAAPYFRVFNPVLQGEKFDADGAYVRRFVPEIAKLPDRFLHRPWDAPDDVLERAGVKLGTDYPVAMVDHGPARDRALKAYKEMRGDT